MPNHVRNIIKMQGITSLDLFTEVDGKPCFDFNKVLPMPATLDMASGSITEESIMYYITERCTIPIARLHNDKREVLEKTVCNALVPSEKWLTEIFMRALDRTFENKCAGDKMYGDGKQYVSNYIQYGATTWYDWRREKWGTKWNSYDNEQVDENTIKFSTAWSRPEPVMRLLAVMYPDARIEHWWADEDAGYNVGYAVYEHMGIEGGPFVNESNEAYETYMFCWGKSKCFYKDENGNWQHYDCDSCTGCD